MFHDEGSNFGKATGKETGFALVSIYSHLNMDVRLPGGAPPCGDQSYVST